MGFEPMTSCLLDRRSNQLSYGAFHCKNGYRYLTTLMFDQTAVMVQKE